MAETKTGPIARGNVVRERFEEGALGLNLVVKQINGSKYVVVNGLKGDALERNTIFTDDVLVGLNGDSLVGFFERTQKASLTDFLSFLTATPNRNLWFFRSNSEEGKYLLPTPKSSAFGEPLLLDKFMPQVYSPNGSSVILSPSGGSSLVSPARAAYEGFGGEDSSDMSQALSGHVDVSKAARPDTSGSTASTYLPSCSIMGDELATGKRGGILRLPFGVGTIGRYIKVIRAQNHFVECKKIEEGHHGDIYFHIVDEHGKVFDIHGPQEKLYDILANSVKREIKKKQLNVTETGSRLSDLAQLVSKPFDRRHRVGKLLPLKKMKPRMKKKHSYKVTKIARGQHPKEIARNRAIMQDHDDHKEEMERLAQEAHAAYDSNSEVSQVPSSDEHEHEHEQYYSPNASALHAGDTFSTINDSGYLPGTEQSQLQSSPSAIAEASTTEVEESAATAEQFSAPHISPISEEKTMVSRPNSRQADTQPVVDHQVNSRPGSRQANSRPGSRQSNSRQSNSRPGSRQANSRPGSRQTNSRPGSKQSYRSRPASRQASVAGSRPGSKQSNSRPQSRQNPMEYGEEVQTVDISAESTIVTTRPRSLSPVQDMGTQTIISPGYTPPMEGGRPEADFNEEAAMMSIPQTSTRGTTQRRIRPKTSNDLPVSGPQDASPFVIPSRANAEVFRSQKQPGDPRKYIAREEDFNADGPFDNRLLTASATMRLSESELSRLRRVEEIRTQQNVTLVQIIEIERRLEEQRITMLQNSMPDDRSRLKSVFTKERKQAGENIKKLVKKHKQELRRAMKTMGVAFLSNDIHDPDGKKTLEVIPQSEEPQKSGKPKRKKKRDPQSRRLKKELGGALKVLNEGFAAQQPLSDPVGGLPDV
jgi:hypothetical protein